MPTFWERVQESVKAAVAAWQGAGAMEWGAQNYWRDLREADRRRVELYQKKWAYYSGHHKAALKTVAGQPNDNVIINDSRRIVDKGVSFLFGKDLEWQLEEGAETEAEAALKNVWQMNRKMTTLHDLGLNGGVCGDYYMHIVPLESGLVKLVNLDPSIAFAYWRDGDIDDIGAYELRYKMGNSVRRTIYAIRDGNAEWEFWTQELKPNSRDWQTVIEEQVWEKPWPPIHHGKNLPNPNEFYGLSDLEDADLNDVVNAAASNLNRTLRRWANPVPFFKGMEIGKELDLSKPITTGNKDATGELLQMMSDLASSHDYLRLLRSAYYQTTRVPQMDPETMQMGAQSGFALKVLHGDLLEKTETKRNLYGDFLIEMNRRILDYLGYGDDNTVELRWQDPLPDNPLERNAEDQFDLDNGLASDETIATRRNIDWESEQVRLEAQQGQRQNVGERALLDFNRGEVR